MAMPPQSIPWWKSRVIVGALISALFKAIFAALVLFDVDVGVTDEELAPLVDALVLLVSFIGDAIAARGRITQRHVPTITAGKGNPHA